MLCIPPALFKVSRELVNTVIFNRSPAVLIKITEQKKCLYMPITMHHILWPAAAVEIVTGLWKYHDCYWGADLISQNERSALSTLGHWEQRDVFYSPHNVLHLSPSPLLGERCLLFPPPSQNSKCMKASSGFSYFPPSPILSMTTRGFVS